MERGQRQRGAWMVGLAVLLVGLAGCGGSSGVKVQDPPSGAATPTHSASASAPVSPSGSPSSATDTATSTKAAVQAAWLHFWQVDGEIDTYPQAQLPELAASVSVDPIKSQLVKAAKADKIIGAVTYGQLVHHIYSTTLVGPKTAHLGDCVDGSHSGSMIKSTGKKRTVGPAKNNNVASLVLGADGKWRVATIAYLTDKPC